MSSAGPSTYCSSATSRCGRDAFDRGDMRRRLGRLVARETVAQAVHQLLDRKQSDKNPAYRDRRIEGGNRRHRGHAEAGKAAQEIQPTEIDEAERYPEHDETRGYLHDSPRCPNQRVCDGGEIEVIVAPGGDRGAGEDRVNEEGRGHLLQPQPGPADLARDDVEDDGRAKAEQQQAAQHHQHGFKRVERAPLEVTLPLKHQAFGDGHDRSMQIRGRQRPASCDQHFGFPRPVQAMPRIKSLILVACGPRSADILSRYGSAIFWKPDLSTSPTILTPIDLSLVADSCSRAIALAGWFLLTSSAAAWTQLFCSGERLLHNLSLTQVKLLFASCSVIDSTGATS